MNKLRLLLRTDHQLRCKQALRLILRDMRAIDDIGNELRAERQREVVAVDISRFLRIDDEQVVPRLTHRDVGVLA